MSASNRSIELVPAVHGERSVGLIIQDDEAIIQLSNWVDGLGWCVEKTMRVDRELLDSMHNQIAAARIRLRERRNERAGTLAAAARVLDFPAS